MLHLITCHGRIMSRLAELLTLPVVATKPFGEFLIVTLCPIYLLLFNSSQSVRKLHVLIVCGHYNLRKIISLPFFKFLNLISFFFLLSTADKQTDI